MATVVLAPHDVLAFSEGGGHMWAFLQYAFGLRSVGCDVWWLEQLTSSDPRLDRHAVDELSRRLARLGLADRLVVYRGASERERTYVTHTRAEAERIFRRADLMLNFAYETDPALLAHFRRNALVDIDPGLLQLWIDGEDLAVSDHDVYFTTGEAVGTADAAFPSCGIDWIHIRPPVSLEQWPAVPVALDGAFTTVSGWWSDEWIADGPEEDWYENNKRASFLEYLELPALVSTPLELALNIDADEEDEARMLEERGWRVARARHVAGTPEAYRSYVQRSRGEFSCAKPSCLRLRNGWISDRTLCYLASGRPAIVQDTGPNALIEGGAGLLRFGSLQEAAGAINSVNQHYDEHSAAARELAISHFDARKVASEILEAALADRPAHSAGEAS